jgi:hypothetical protein
MMGVKRYKVTIIVDSKAPFERTVEAEKGRRRPQAGAARILQRARL